MDRPSREELYCQQCGYRASIRPGLVYSVLHDPQEYADVIAPGDAEDLHHLGREHFKSLAMRR